VVDGVTLAVAAPFKRAASVVVASCGTYLALRRLALLERAAGGQLWQPAASMSAWWPPGSSEKVRSASGRVSIWRKGATWTLGHMQANLDLPEEAQSPRLRR